MSIPFTFNAFPIHSPTEQDKKNSIESLLAFYFRANTQNFVWSSIQCEWFPSAISAPQHAEKKDNKEHDKTKIRVKYKCDERIQNEEREYKVKEHYDVLKWIKWKNNRIAVGETAQKEKFIEKVKVRKPVYFVAPTLFERTKKWKTNRQQPTKECQNRRKS